MIPSKLQQFKSILLEGDVRGSDPVLDRVTGPVVAGGCAATVVGGGVAAAVVAGGGTAAAAAVGGDGAAENVNMINKKKLNIRHLLKNSRA
ncbi:hypothetical protein CEXT_303751 [Caerostris extrusa]|uniref:Uncharacterized protein n=1 Tax=Caerostris extrusa TaxID=172846 RepID=A0AAV4XS09_CAEEX|nr:hypothetical protein CEXT_303751 [Caerostris extrusa]